MSGFPYVATEQVGLGDLATPQHTRLVLTRGLRYVRAVRWTTQASLPELEGQRLAFTDHDGEHVVWVSRDAALGGGLSLSALIRIDGGYLWAHIAADTEERITAFVEELAAAAPRAVVDDDDPRVPVTFWSLGSMGPTSRTRMLNVLAWDDVERNYVGTTAVELGGLVGDFTPAAGGQLVVWHGPPGTGKTSALRALAWEWRAWCDLHYITDPEVFFGDRASYMLDVLLDETNGTMLPSSDEAPAPPVDERAKDGRWRMLVLEDTGELLARDAKDRTGQGLGRLLNVVDGLIGQGLRVLVLVTTNEELRTLHPAIQRPGRCASKIEFAEFPTDAARAWLDDADGDAELPVLSDRGSIPLSDLYAMIAGRETASSREPAGMGFGR